MVSKDGKKKGIFGLFTRSNRTVPDRIVPPLSTAGLLSRPVELGTFAPLISPSSKPRLPISAPVLQTSDDSLSDHTVAPLIVQPDATISGGAGVRSKSQQNTGRKQTFYNGRYASRGLESMDIYKNADDYIKSVIAAQKVDEIREETNTVVIQHNPASSPPNEPKHPNHTLVWNSKNLRCSIHSNNCTICNDACCASENAVQRLHANTTPPHEKVDASRLLTDLDFWYTIGREPSTFLQCNKCKRIVCPGCCSVCPDPLCNIRLCTDCNPVRWSSCDWHNTD